MDNLVTKPLAGLHAGPVPQAPPRPTRVGRHLLSTIALAVALGYAAQVIELRPLELVRDLGNIGVFLKGYLNPSFLHVKEYAWQCVVTVCIALWGTVLAIVIAVPGVAGCRQSGAAPAALSSGAAAHGSLPRGE